MIRPDRHTNLDFSIINISSLILTYLNGHYAIKYDLLMEKIIDDLGNEAKENYPYAINFLFLLDKIKYFKETDSFIYNETK
jgi:hypothetical protein